MFWRHVVAAEAEVEETGNEQYADEHMSAIFKEGMSFSGYERDYLGWSEQGERLIDISGVSGIDSISDGRGAAFADFDNDGDLDVFLVSLQRRAHELFRNEVGADAGFLRVALRGTHCGTDAYGAEVRVGTPAGSLTKVKAGGSGFLAQHDPRLLFGLGDAPRADWIEVTWPDGRTRRIDRLPGETTPGIPAGASLRVTEDGPVELVGEHRFALADPPTDEERLLAGLEFGLGDPFPDLAILGRDRIPGGEELPGTPARSLHELLRPGRKLLVNIWATWCVPCRREMPELQALHPRLQEQGIDLVGLSIDTDTLDRVEGFVQQVNTTYPIHVSHDERLPDLYRDGALTVPLSVLLDDRGRVLQVIGGWSTATAERFRALAGSGA